MGMGRRKLCRIRTLPIIANRWAESITNLPSTVAILRGVSAFLPDCGGGRLVRAKRFFSAASRKMSQRYGLWVSYFSEPMNQRLYGFELRALLEQQRPTGWMEALFAKAGNVDPIDASMSADVDSYLPFDLQVKVDITSIANSLEARSPFLDHEVMEFAAHLPVSMKLRGRQSKYLLKRAFADLSLWKMSRDER